MRWMVLVSMIVALLGSAKQASAVLFFQGFESPAWTSGGNDWNDFNSSIVRVTSGTSGVISLNVPSSDGVAHALIDATVDPDRGVFTRFGGYNYGAGTVPGIPFGDGFTTKLDIYLDPAGHANVGTSNDTRFDYDTAISQNSDGGFQRDNIFAIGFYNSSDVTGPGAGSDRFIISESHGGGGNPKGGTSNTPFAITSTGWYTFEHKFYDDGLGFVAVDMSIYDAATDSLLTSWTLNPGDPVATTSGNRYGWILNLGLDELFIDNTSLELNAPANSPLPEPSTLSLAGLVCAAGFAIRRRRRAG